MLLSLIVLHTFRFCHFVCVSYKTGLKDFLQNENFMENAIIYIINRTGVFYIERTKSAMMMVEVLK